ncbi:DNA replication and repair protein RecF [Austwickia chelonae]|uniref:DNA replication and repair protein RecF n=1 Tax=Austwickia chelonae NBRC 105200 TaxID=1184607 RepID=K6UNL6_9MICO|nr:DNA replication/repair protein RecF [Austwickia chelonae]GAB79071.1 DNA replication and repair protein RecF [Austwickia chelonae NBRC 105200]SEW42052.1 DNA replication and repair protein RecF [Austwickia chelonae]
MRLRHLSLMDFRSYAAAELPLSPGTTILVGANGQGKTNLVEAVGYLATLGSHRVSQDGPLVRQGAQRALVKGAIVRADREQLVEIEIIPGKANRARLNRSTQTKPRDVLGVLRTVLFAPEDLELVKGDPAERRRFLDGLLVARQPRWAATRSDYERILRQRNALLKSAAPDLRRRSSRGRGGQRQVSSGHDERVAAALHTLDIWDEQLAGAGAQLLYGRLRILRDLSPFLAEAYDEVSASTSYARATYRSSLREGTARAVLEGEVPTVDELREAFRATLVEQRAAEVERGVSLSGPHRDDLMLSLGELPAKGYASHGESWSFALALRLASFQLLRRDLQNDPVLILDDVFAELDSGRRERLAALAADAEQVLVTAAVAQDIPSALQGTVCEVTRGVVSAADRSVTETQIAPGGEGACDD